MSNTGPHTTNRDRMLKRITDMQATVAEHLPTTDSLFASTARLREELIAQRDDAQSWAVMLEGGTEQEEALAGQLMDYRDALESALDIDHPAPHYQATVSGLDQRLDPDQVEAVMESQALQQCADASMENALYSGNHLLGAGDSGEHPFKYREYKRSWDQECSAGADGETLYGYTPMAPVKEQVEIVLSDQQLIEHQQRQIDAAMISHLPSAQRLGVDVLQRHALDLYAAPMIDPPQAGVDHHTTAAMTPSPHLHSTQEHGPSLG